VDICIATITWARDRSEEVLIQRSLTALSAGALPIVVADGGSSSDFLDSVRRVPHLTVVQPEARGLIPQIKASLSAAANLGPRFILYAESDKLMFFEQKLGRFLREAPSADDVGVLLAARDEESFATFPRTQRITESAINTLTGDFVGTPGDYSYGPFLFHCSLAAHVNRLPADAGWGWRHYLFAVAARLGLRVTHVVDDLPCPEDQREEGAAERGHRLKQLTQNVSGLLLGIDSPL
jgi:hypothetical protein